MARRRPPQPTLFPYTTLFRSTPGRHTNRAFFDNTIKIVAGLSQGDLALLTEQQRKELPAHLTCWIRSEEHTSELQSRFDLVCRLLLEKQKTRTGTATQQLAPH